MIRLLHQHWLAVTSSDVPTPRCRGDRWSSPGL